jgi:hypothetical protein
VNSHVGQNLPIDFDRQLLQARHELAVGDAVTAAAGIDPGDPQVTEDALFGPAVTVRLLPSAHD